MLGVQTVPKEKSIPILVDEIELSYCLYSKNLIDSYVQKYYVMEYSY